MDIKKRIHLVQTLDGGGVYNVIAFASARGASIFPFLENVFESGRHGITADCHFAVVL